MEVIHEDTTLSLLWYLLCALSATPLGYMFGSSCSPCCGGGVVPTSCDDCCPLPLEDGDAASIQLSMNFQAWQCNMAIAGGGSAVRRFPGLTLSGSGTCFYISDTSPQAPCAFFRRDSQSVYSEYTRSIPAGVTEGPERVEVQSTYSSNQCKQSAFVRFYVPVIDLFYLTASQLPRDVLLSRPGDPIGGHIYFEAGTVALPYGVGGGLCLEETTFPMKFSDVKLITYGSSLYVTQAFGSDCGSITVTGIE